MNFVLIVEFKIFNEIFHSKVGKEWVKYKALGFG